MPVGLVEPFDLYGTGLPLTNFWQVTADGGGLGLVTGLVSGVGLAMQQAPGGNIRNSQMRRALPYAHAKQSFGFWYKNALPGVENTIWEFQNSSGGANFSISLLPTGKLKLNGGSGFSTVSQHEWQLQSNITYHFAFYVDLSGGLGSTASFKMVVNGDVTRPIFDVTAADLTNTGDNAIAILAFQSMALGVTWAVDHIINLYNETVILPELELFSHGATADSLAEWTKSAGSANYQNIDDIPSNGDTDYNYTDTTGARDKFVLTDMPVSPEEIYMVSAVSIARKEDSATRAIKNVLEIGGVDYQGAIEHFLSVDYTQRWDHWQTNPATSAAWTEAQINALKGGYQLTVGA